MIPNQWNFKFTQTALLIMLLLFAQPGLGKHILVYGDSISAAYGMDPDQGWVHLLDQKLGDKHIVTNASISGETTHGGLARLPVTLDELNPDIVLIELGANDGMQGRPISQIRNNLEKMIELSKKSGAEVVLTGISIPPSYGPRYIDQFRKMFVEIAAQRNLTFIDLYRQDIFTKEGYIQSDGLHPTEKTQPIISDSVYVLFTRAGLLD